MKNILIFGAIIILCAPAQAFPGSAESSQEVGDCAPFFAQVHEAVVNFGGEDASAPPVPGHPVLRTGRFLEEMRYYVTDREEAEAWLDLAFDQSISALEKEIANLPRQALVQLLNGLGLQGDTPSQDNGDLLMRRVRECAGTLLVREQAHTYEPGFFLNRTEIPAEYRTWRKTLGLYPLFTIPIGAGIINYKNKVTRGYALPLEELKPQGRLTLLAPEEIPFPQSEGETAASILASAADNPLRIPILDEKSLVWVANLYAPTFEQDVTGDYDLPGAMEWQGPRVSVNTKKPTAYYYATHALIRGVPHLQLNYTFWYTRRPRISLMDIEPGRIHGMTLRITLNPRGEPVMIDAIHNCGCYHFFFPSKDVFQEPRTGLFREDAFVPQWLPASVPGERLAVRIGSRRHWVERLRYAESLTTGHAVYELLPYEILESLPNETGEKQSIFTSEGIVKGETQRPERFILFAPGIPEIGSMRQRTHHATALIGERTFDDPQLFENFFVLRPAH